MLRALPLQDGMCTGIHVRSPTRGVGGSPPNPAEVSSLGCHSQEQSEQHSGSAPSQRERTALGLV